MLNTANNWTGDTTVADGTLKLGASGVIPSGAGYGNLIMTNAGVLFNAAISDTVFDLNGFSQGINGLSHVISGSDPSQLGLLLITNSGASPVTLTLGNNNASGNYGGTIADGGNTLSLVKTGSGTQTLGGTNTYIGTTTVSNGTLLVNGSLGANTVTVVAGAALGGNGLINGSVIIQSGGTNQPGSGGINTDTLTISNALSLAGTTLFTINRGNARVEDRVAGISTVAYGGTLAVNNAGPAIHPGDVFTLFSATGQSGIRNNVLNTAQPNPTGSLPPINPDYKQNQFGATLGGPIKKDRTFIFGSYEGLRNVQGVTSSSGTVFLPTPQEVGGDFSEGGNAQTFGGMLTDQNFANVLQARPGCSAAVASAGGASLTPGNAWLAIFPNNVIPTQCFDPTAVALYNNYVAPFGTGTIFPISNNHERSDQFTIRLDHKITSTQQFSAYYYFNDDGLTSAYSNFQAAGSTVPGFGALNATRNQQINLSHTWTLGSTAVNEFRFNYYREGQEKLNHPVNILSTVHDACGSAVPAANCFADPANPSGGITTSLPGHEGVPFIAVSGGFAIGNNSEGELPQAGNTFQWTDNYTKTTGRHTLKFGGEVRRSQFNQFLYYNINGLYNFANSGPENEVSSDSNFAAYPNYFLGIPTTYSQGAAQGENDRNTSVALFAQDSFKLKPNLTLNYGLRWELNTPFYDKGNRLQTFRPGQITTQYPCDLNPNNISSQALIAAYGSTDCSPTGPANSVFPTGLVFPGDKGVPRGLTSTYYKAFAPRIGIAWSTVLGRKGFWARLPVVLES